jgi:uncharacterized membrane protein
MALAASIALAACDALGPIPACPDGGTSVTWDNFASDYFGAFCNRCHAASSTDRNGAPTTFTFDTLEEALAHRDRIFYRATGDLPTMPPGPDKPPAAERQQLADWLRCAPP